MFKVNEEATVARRREGKVHGVMGNRSCGVMSITRRALERPMKSFE